MMDINQAFQQAVAKHQSGALQEAEAIYRDILRIDHNHLPSIHNLGLLAMRVGNHPIAVRLLRVCAEADPVNALFQANFIAALLEAEQPEKAREVLDRAAQAGMPAPFLSERGVQVEAALAVKAEQDAIVKLFQAGEIAAMESAARGFLERHPGRPRGMHLLGLSLAMRGKHPEAFERLSQAAQRLPADAQVFDHLGSVCRSLGRLEEAAAHHRRALALNPGFAEAHSNLGAALRDLGMMHESLTHLNKALELNPACLAAYNNKALVLQFFGRTEEAVACCRKALEIDPDYVEAYVNLGNVLQELGRRDEAAERYRQALRINPQSRAAHGNLLLLMAFSENVSPASFLEECGKFDLELTQRALRDGEALIPPPRPGRKGRRLRIGYVSGDFLENHPVPFFLRPVFAGRDRQRMEVFVYSCLDAPNPEEQRLRALTDGWTSLVGLSDAEAAERIRRDGVDVLVDLCGHVQRNRLGVFARRAAPVQAHYLGYCATTGLSQMDYWIGDAILFPEEREPYFSERPWRLPRPWLCYDPGVGAPSPTWRERGEGEFVLGTFNHLSKITGATVALWSRILQALPKARLLLKTSQLKHEVNRRRMMDAFAAQGVDPKRVTLHGGVTDWASHMAAYDVLDVALDPVGAVGGATTTSDALWMGVPVVTMRGGKPAQRMSASMVSALGRPEWVVANEDAYVAKVLELAGDVALRKSLRLSQRETMRRSLLCDGRDMARCLEEAYEAMFDARPGGTAPE